MSIIQLYTEHPDTYERQILGTITKAQLDFLVDNLDDEFEDNEECFIIPEIVIELKEQGADSHIIAMLEKALARSQEGVDIYYSIE